ncbi:MAG: DUF2314 domain-containing protein [Candidatus Binatia bacterium]
MKTNVAEIGLGFVGLCLFFLFLCLMYVIPSEPSGVTLASLFGATTILSCCFLRLWQCTQQRPRDTLTSLVLLLRTPRTLTIDQIRQAVASALGVHCERDNTAATNYVIATPPSFVVHVEGCEFLVNSVSDPYIDPSQNIPDNIPNLRLQQVIRDHHAWLSVDALHTPPNATADHVYRCIGRVIAALAADDCVGIYCPATNQLNVWRESLIEHLCGPNPLQAVAEPVDVPAVRVTANDTHMQAAVSEATSMWSAFVTAFEKRRADQTFAVKAPFTDETETEFMWVIVSDIAEETIFGTLDNEPIYLTNVCVGDSVTITVAQVNDWLYTDGTEMVGGFTTHALVKQVA